MKFLSELLNLLNDYQWLLGLVIGFVLNQITITLNRLRKKRDRNKMFKRHILFIKNKLDYVSKELEKIHNVTYVSAEAKENFIQNVIDSRNYLINIPKQDIPDKLIYEITDLTGDYIFFVNSMRKTKISVPFFDFHEENDDRREFVKEVAKRQRENVEYIFNYLDIK